MTRDRNRRGRAVQNSSQLGRTCGKCLLPIDPGEPVWIANADAFNVSHRVPVHRHCAPPEERYGPPRPCVTCGRDVYEVEGSRRRDRATCSQRCETIANKAVIEGRRRTDLNLPPAETGNVKFDDQKERDLARSEPRSLDPVSYKSNEPWREGL